MEIVPVDCYFICFVEYCVRSSSVICCTHIVFSDALVDLVVLKCSMIWVMADMAMNMEEWSSKYL